MIAAALAAGVLAAAPLADAVTSRVNVDSRGAETLTNHSDAAGISADGRYVVFTSGSANLVLGDTNGRADVFAHDRATGRTRRVSVRSAAARRAGARTTSTCRPSSTGTSWPRARRRR